MDARFHAVVMTVENQRQKKRAWPRDCRRTPTEENTGVIHTQRLLICACFCYVCVFSPSKPGSLSAVCTWYVTILLCIQYRYAVITWFSLLYVRVVLLCKQQRYATTRYRDFGCGASNYTLLLQLVRPMTMETRCSKVIFPNDSKKKPAEDTPRDGSVVLLLALTRRFTL